MSTTPLEDATRQLLRFVGNGLAYLLIVVVGLPVIALAVIVAAAYRALPFVAWLAVVYLLYRVIPY